MTSKQTKITKKSHYHFFWGTESPLSQWHPSEYELNGVVYLNAEQGMMHGKALLFDDKVTAKKITKAYTPKECKKLGRQVHSFEDEVWNEHRERIVYENNLAKFLQNDSMKAFLLSTKGEMLVEASPVDRIWGIGLGAAKAREVPEEEWLGLNLLGKVLMHVRETILLGDVGEQSSIERTDES